MPDFSSISFPKPKDWQELERGARLLFQHTLNDPNTQNNGRAGQRQHGVDVYGNRGGRGGPLVGVQCKGKDADFGGSVTAKELEDEVRKTEKFRPALREFILITTAPDDANIQKAARLLEQKLQKEGRDLTVSVWGWGRIEAEIRLYPDAIRQFHPDASPFTDEIMGGLSEILKLLQKRERVSGAADEREQSPIVSAAQTQIAGDAYVSEDPLDKHLHEQIDTYRDYLRNDRPKTALELLEKLKERVFAGASSKIKFRILGNIGAAHHRLGHYDVAADNFLEAYTFASDEIAAIANKVAALLIKGRPREARELALHAIATHPDNADIALQYLQAKGEGQSVEDLWPKLHGQVRNNPNLIAIRIAALRETDDKRWRELAGEAAGTHPGHQRLKILKAESVLERVIDADRSMLGVQHDGAPTQTELIEAAETLQAAWEQSRKLESPPETPLAHNGALLWKILRDDDKARQMLDTGIEAGLQADEAFKLRLSLYRHPADNAAAVMLSERLTDTPQSRIIRAELLIDSDPAKARELLAERAAFVDRDVISAAYVVVESLVKEQKFDEALAEAEGLTTILPEDPNGPLLIYRIKLARADEDAQKYLEAAVAKVADNTDFPTRFLVCEGLEKARRFEDVVDLLVDRTSTAFDSMALRMLIAAAANADRRHTLSNLLGAVPAAVRDLPFYRGSRIALAIKTGDTRTVEREIRGYLRDRPRSLEMQLQLLHALFRQDKIDALKGEVAKPASDFDGSASDVMTLAQFKEGFGDWREAYALAYATLLKNPNDAAASMGYVGVFLRPGHAGELDISPKDVTINVAVELRGDDEKPYVVVIEPDHELRPSPQYIAPTHRLATILLGKTLNDQIDRPDGTTAKIASIKPKELHALHELMNNFQNAFPDTQGLERVRFNTSSPGGMEEFTERLQQRHETIATVTSLYESGTLPLALAARSVGADAVEMMVGLSSSGTAIRVCQGTRTERESAFRAIELNDGKGCVLDYLTFHVARRLELMNAVIAVCGPIGIVDKTADRYQRKIFELQERIDEPDHTLSWKDNQIYRIETSVFEKRKALAALQSDADWIKNHCVIVPAEGRRDPGRELRQLMHHFGSGFVDELRAAQGADLLLVSEDQILRNLSMSEFEVPSTWLQPVLIKAKNIGALNSEEYRKAVVAMIDARFQFISMDAQVLIGAVATHKEVTLPKEFNQLASLLGGKLADLRSHINVALGTIRDTWKNQNVPSTARQAIAGKLLYEVTKERSRSEIVEIVNNFILFGEMTLQDPEFEQYILGWMRGHFIPL